MQRIHELIRPAVAVGSAAVIAMASLVTPAAAGVPVVRTPADADYAFSLRSGPTGRTWRGDGSISFTNVGVDPLPEVYVRVWSNGVLGCSNRSIVVSNVQGGAITDESLACTQLEV